MNETEKNEQPPDTPKTTQAETLLKLVTDTGAAFFHDETDTPYASITMSGHRETWSMNGSHFKMWLKRLFYHHSNGKPIQNEALGQANVALWLRHRRLF